MKIWIDIESGTYGNAENIVFVDISDWTNDELQKFSDLSDDDRSEMAYELNRINEVLQ